VQYTKYVTVYQDMLNKMTIKLKGWSKKEKKAEVKEVKESKVEKKVEKPVSTVEENEIKNVESPTAIMARKIQELMRN